MFNSQANQDEFVYFILNKQNSGVFVDVGSNNPIHWNNSCFLETIGWNGICIDIEPVDYSNRTFVFELNNAIDINYNKLFLKNNVPLIVDYLSIIY